MLPLIFGTSFLVGLTGAMAPGPLLSYDIAETARRGFWAGPALVLGHALLELLLLLGLARGLSQFLGQGVVTGTVGILGGLFLIGMGAFMVLKRREEPALAENPSGRSWGPVLAGALLSLSYPYWLLWWATVGSTYVLWSLETGPWGLASFFSGHILSDLAWYSLVSLLVASGRKFLTGRLYQGIILASALFLLGLGAFFLASGLRWLAG